MSSRKNHKIIYIAVLTTALLLALSSIALADTLNGDALVSSSGTQDVIVRTVPGGTTVTYNFSAWIVTTGPGEDVFPGSVKVDITRTGDWLYSPSGTPGSFELTGYGDANAKEGSIVISVPCGSYDPEVSVKEEMTAFLKANQSSNGNSLPEGKDSVTLTYRITAGPDDQSCAPANNPPSVTITGVADGSSYEYGSVPVAGCSVVDTEDGNSSFGALLSEISGSLAAYGLFPQTASCSYTDGGGLTSTASATYSIVDLTDPVITFVSRTPANSYGWNNDDVVVTWSCTDNVGVLSDIVSVTISDEGENQSATGTCEDVAGNTAEDTQDGINIDLTDPTISAALDKSPAATGWFNIATGAPTVSFTCGDELSGLDDDGCPGSHLFGEGAGQSWEGTVYDKAGNGASVGVSDIDVDLTAPTIMINVPEDGGDYSLNEPVASDYSCSDVTSKIATCEGPVANGDYFDTSMVGSNDFTVTATDKAGNSNTLTHTYYVNYIFLGFFSPVNNPDTVNSAKAGQAIPIKWQLTDYYGNPVEVKGDWSVTALLTGTCGSGPVDQIETYAGSSGWQYLGDGYWQFNWKTPKSYAGLCLTMTLNLGDGNTDHFAYFKFK